MSVCLCVRVGGQTGEAGITKLCIVIGLWSGIIIGWSWFTSMHSKISFHKMGNFTIFLPSSVYSYWFRTYLIFLLVLSLQFRKIPDPILKFINYIYLPDDAGRRSIPYSSRSWVPFHHPVPLPPLIYIHAGLELSLVIFFLSCELYWT